MTGIFSLYVVDQSIHEEFHHKVIETFVFVYSSVMLHLELEDHVVRKRIVFPNVSVIGKATMAPSRTSNFCWYCHRRSSIIPHIVHKIMFYAEIHAVEIINQGGNVDYLLVCLIFRLSEESLVL
jgi:hypothetical protein